MEWVGIQWDVLWDSTVLWCIWYKMDIMGLSVWSEWGGSQSSIVCMGWTLWLHGTEWQVKWDPTGGTVGYYGPIFDTSGPVWCTVTHYTSGIQWDVPLDARVPHDTSGIQWDVQWDPGGTSENLQLALRGHTSYYSTSKILWTFDGKTRQPSIVVMA